MTCVTKNGQTRVSSTSHLLDICQTERDVMSVRVSHEADMVLANLADGYDTLPLHAKQWF